MKPINFKYSNKVLNKPEGVTDKECGVLNVHSDGKYCISCWRSSLWERIKFLFTGKTWVYVWSGQTQPPISLQHENPWAYLQMGCNK